MRIAAFAGFYGDRSSGLKEALSCEPDVVIGDYLAELTMLVLKKNMSRGRSGYAEGVIGDLAPWLETIEQRGVKVVTNAGGLDPQGCAAAVHDLAAQSGRNLRVAWISGDGVLDHLRGEWAAGRHPVRHLETGAVFDDDPERVLTANAYLGCWPIVTALQQGADIVICPRVTDASLVMGPAAWKFGWHQDDWDRLAGALTAGHLIECGAQVSGGNYSFFHEHADLGVPGMPFADLTEAGDCFVGKAPHTGGTVTVDTVKAQILYEMGGRFYQNPDVMLDVRSVQLAQAGDDRVHVFDARGAAPTDTTKVSVCYDAGYRNSMTVGLTGREIGAKVDWVQRLLDLHIQGDRPFESLEITRVGPAEVGAPSYADNTAFLVITVRDQERERVDRTNFSQLITSYGVSSIPGFYTTTPPQSARQYAVQWPCLIDKSHVQVMVGVAGQVDGHVVPWGPGGGNTLIDSDAERSPTNTVGQRGAEEPVELEFGCLFGTRSGDKGGIANLGVWARNEPTWRWLDEWLTTERLQQLLPELSTLKVERHRFDNILALNFLAFDFLWEGASACLRIDPQAKGLGEYLAARRILVPRDVLAAAQMAGAEDRPSTASHAGTRD